MGRLAHTLGAIAAAMTLELSAIAGPLQNSAPPEVPATATYRGIVAAYRGQDADSMRRLAALDPTALAAVVDDILSGRRSTDWPPDDLQAAAMLHTDTAIELMKLGSVERGIVHINVASRLIDATLDISAAQKSYGARWYAFAAAVVHIYSPAWSDELRKRVPARFSGSPAEGALRRARQQELAAQKDLSQRHGHSPGQINGIDVVTARRFMGVVRAFEEPVRLDPQLFEAWLHLGRARMMSGDPAGAVEALEKATAAPDRRFQYLALMFLGAVAERSGTFGEAEQRYRDAAATYRWGQSAPLALAQLLSRTSRESDARDVMSAHLARSRGIVIDPLWTYFLGTDELLSATLNELRAEVWR